MSVGGKPNKGTPADRRLKENRGMPMKPMKSTPPPVPRPRPARKGNR